jgi:poly(3-hydroxyalkanoate) synthetase
VVEDNPDWKKRERAKFLTGILTSAMSPTNTLIGNPAALKKAYETGGMSLVRGTQNMVGDMVAGKRLPSQVKASDFKVGENLAATPGAVVFRNIFENNPLPKPGAMTVLGQPIDLSSIKVETLVTGALTDHLTPWKACYRTTQLFAKARSC